MWVRVGAGGCVWVHVGACGRVRVLIYSRPDQRKKK